MSVTTNAIYIALNARNPTKEDPEKYHWLLWLVDKDISNGMCVHATNPTGAFVFENKVWRATASMNLVALLQIGHLGSHSIDELVNELRKVPMHNTQVENGFFNCRVWLGQALANLVKHGVIHCDNIPALEQDAITEADKVREEVETGETRVAVNVTELSY